jgi:hypothetical protein
MMLSPGSLRALPVISRIGKKWLMSKHELLELNKIIEETIGSLREEVEIGTNVKLNPLYISDRRGEIEFRIRTTRIIQEILKRDIDEQQQQLGVNNKRLEMMQIIEFENTLQERIQELKLKLKDCDDLRESDILINEWDTIGSTLGRLMDLKYGEKARAIEIAESNQDFKRANQTRKQFAKIYTTEDEIRAQCSKT